MPSKPRSQKSWVRAPRHKGSWSKRRRGSDKDEIVTPLDPNFPNYSLVPHNPRYPPNHDFTAAELAIPPVPHAQHAFAAGPEGVFNAFGAPRDVSVSSDGGGPNDDVVEGHDVANNHNHPNPNNHNNNEEKSPITYGSAPIPHHAPLSSSPPSPYQSQRHTRTPRPRGQSHVRASTSQRSVRRALQPGELERVQCAGQTELGERVRGEEGSRYVEMEGGREEQEQEKGQKQEQEKGQEHPWKVETVVYLEQVSRVKRGAGVWGEGG